MAKGLLKKFGDRYRIFIKMRDDNSTHFNNLTKGRMNAIYNQVASGKGMIGCEGLHIPVSNILYIKVYDYDQWNEDQL